MQVYTGKIPDGREDGSLGDEPITAATVNEGMYKEALRIVTRDSRELFLRRGKQLSFPPDRC